MSNGKSKTISGDCYAPGDILLTAKYKGEQGGTDVLGKLVEFPIVLDYIRETHHVDDKVVPFAQLLETDWWDMYIGARGLQSYRDFLGKQLTALNRKKLDALKPEPARPDILTRNGPVYSLGGGRFLMNRNEYYEIKPDSPSGLVAWEGPQGRKEEGKKYKLEKFYKDFGLTYDKGTTYPANPLNTKNISLPVNLAFIFLANILIKRHKIKRVLCYLTVRRQQPGLLLYKVCIEIETDDERKQQALARAVAKNLFAAYVVCHRPELFNSLVVPMGDTTLEGDQIPQVRCKFDVIDEIKGMSKSLADIINSRALGLPGQEFMICCDERFYQSHVVALQSNAFLASPISLWERYATERPAFHVSGPVSVLIGKTLDAMEFTEETVRQIMAQVRAHPEIVSLIIVVGAVVVTAGVAAYLAPLVAEAASVIGAGMSASASEAIVAETTPGILRAFGQMAMNQSIVTRAATAEIAEITAARGLMSSAEVIAQLGASGVSGAHLARMLAGAKAVSLAAGAILVLSSRSAFAAGSSNVAPIATEFSSLFMAPAAAIESSARFPEKHKRFDLNTYTISTSNLFGPRPPNMARYLGRVTLS